MFATKTRKHKKITKNFGGPDTYRNWCFSALVAKNHKGR